MEIMERAKTTRSVFLATVVPNTRHKPLAAAGTSRTRAPDLLPAWLLRISMATARPHSLHSLGLDFAPQLLTQGEETPRGW